METEHHYIFELNLYNYSSVTPNRSVYLRVARNAEETYPDTPYLADWEVGPDSKLTPTWISSAVFSTIDSFLSELRKVYEHRHPHLIQFSQNPFIKSPSPPAWSTYYGSSYVISR